MGHIGCGKIDWQNNQVAKELREFCFFNATFIFISYFKVQKKIKNIYKEDMNKGTLHYFCWENMFCINALCFWTGFASQVEDNDILVPCKHFGTGHCCVL